MFSRFRKLFSRKKSDLIAVIDIGSQNIKAIIIDKKNPNKALAFGTSKQGRFAMRNSIITDLKSVIKSVNEALDAAEEKICESVSSLVFGVNGDSEVFCRKSFKGHLQTIADEVGGKFLGYYCIPKLYSYSIKDAKNYILLDIGATTSSIILVKDGFFKKLESFQIGGDIFTKRIANIFTISYEEAEKLKIKYCSGVKTSQILKPSDFKQDINLWLTAFCVSLKNLGEKSLPGRIFMTGGGSLFPHIRDSISSQSFPCKKTGFTDTPIVKHISKAGISLNGIGRQDKIIPFMPVKMFGEFVGQNME